MVGLGLAGRSGGKLSWMEPNCTKRLIFETNFIDRMLCKTLVEGLIGGRSHPVSDFSFVLTFLLKVRL